MTKVLPLILFASCILGASRADEVAQSSATTPQAVPTIMIEVRYIQVDATKLRLFIDGYRPQSGNEPLPVVSTRVIRVSPVDAMHDTSVDESSAREFGDRSIADGESNAPHFEGVVLEGPVEFRSGLDRASPLRDNEPDGNLDISEVPEGIRILVGPKLLIESGKNAGCSVGSNCAYLEGDGSGCLRVKRITQFDDDPILSLPEGAGFEIEATLQDDGAIKLGPMTFAYRRIVGREPIDGVPFEVGKPVIKTQRMSISLVMRQKATAVFAFPRDGQNDPLILALVQAYEIKDMPSNSSKDIEASMPGTSGTDGRDR